MKGKVKILTGVRPSSDLTVANYLGAIKPIVELQQKKVSPMVLFLADLHGITDQEPQKIRKYTLPVLADYLALGVDPKKVKIYLQSDLAPELSQLTLFLSREISVAELLRVPTLKDKLKAKQKPEHANTFLFLYPVLMAADILIMKAEKIPVGQDQLPHLEITREIARKFNKKYKEVFVLPQPLIKEAPKILSLVGKEKMSKTKPQGAIFLTDKKEVVVEKIKGAETAIEGQMTENLQSLILMAKGLAKNEKEKEEVERIIKEHLAGKKVMVAFKEKLAKIVADFVTDFQKKRRKFLKEKKYLFSILEEGKNFAKKISQQTLFEVKKALKF